MPCRVFPAYGKYNFEKYSCHTLQIFLNHRVYTMINASSSRAKSPAIVKDTYWNTIPAYRFNTFFFWMDSLTNAESKALSPYIKRLHPIMNGTQPLVNQPAVFPRFYTKSLSNGRQTHTVTFFQTALKYQP